MTARDRRLSKLEGALTPSQAILRFLDDLTEQGSLVAHYRAQQGLPATALPLVRLLQQIEQATRQAHPREPREAVDRAVRQAVRDAVFLHCLLMRVNEALYAERRLRWYQLATLTSELAAPLRELQGRDHEPAHLERAARLVVELHANVQAVEMIAERYYAGRDIRCPEQAEDQELLMEQLAAAIGLYEEATALLADEAPPAGKRHHKATAATYPRLDHAAIARTAAQFAEGIATAWIDLAKSEALRFMGQTEQAIAITARYL